MASIEAVQQVFVCPVCHTKGMEVQGQTVKSLVSVSLRAVRDTVYLFCRDSACSVVYFSADGEHFFTTAQVRERVYLKAALQDDVLICYCFQYHVSDIVRATAQERNAVIDNIVRGVKANQCACDLRNPQGLCCLGNIRTLIHTENLGD